MHATINLRRTATHDTHWESRNDDHPVTTTHHGWAVDLRVTGKASWGPYRFRETAQKEHSGTSQVELHSIDYFFCKNESDETELREIRERAEKLACDLGTKLESKGFKVELTFDERIPFEVEPGRESWEPKKRQVWSAETPKICRRNCRVKIEDIAPLEKAS